MGTDGGSNKTSPAHAGTATTDQPSVGLITKKTKGSW